MANEIQKTTKLSWSKNGAQIVVNITETMDQVGDQAIENVQIIGAASEAIVFGDVTGSAHIIFKNLTDTWSSLTAAEKVATGESTEADYITHNSVYIGTDSPAVKGSTQFKLRPGAGVQMTTDILTWYAIRDTEDVNLLVAAIEE